MTAPRIKPTPFAIDRGIESIMFAAEDAEPALPAGEFGPAFFPLKPRLDQLYAMPNFDDYMREELAPAIGKAALLLPYRSGQAIESARAHLLAAAAREPRHARLFGRAVSVLDDLDEMTALLQEYRMALVQG